MSHGIWGLLGFRAPCFSWALALRLNAGLHRSNFISSVTAQQHAARTPALEEGRPAMTVIGFTCQEDASWQARRRAMNGCCCAFGVLVCLPGPAWLLISTSHVHRRCNLAASTCRTSEAGEIDSLPGEGEELSLLLHQPLIQIPLACKIHGPMRPPDGCAQILLPVCLPRGSTLACPFLLLSTYCG